MKLLPGLAKPIVDEIHRGITKFDEVPAVREKCAGVKHPDRIWLPTGGIRADDEWLNQTAQKIRSIAENNGYPYDKNYRSFDIQTAISLSEYMGDDIPLGELLRPEFWSYFAASALPDVSLWRFPKLPRERLEGGIRNVFKRLWWRAFLLQRSEPSDDRWLLVREMTEDGLVAITERPGISSSRKLAQAYGEAWVRANETKGKYPMEEIGRRAAKFMTARNVVIMIDGLEDSQLRDMVNQLFIAAKDSMELESGNP